MVLTTGAPDVFPWSKGVPFSITMLCGMSCSNRMLTTLKISLEWEESVPILSTGWSSIPGAVPG